MIPITEFPYGSRRSESHPMHERMLLLKMERDVGTWFAVGFYDSIHDVFRVCGSGHKPNGNPYDERPVAGSKSDHERESRHCDKNWIDDYYCVFPEAFIMAKGQRTINSFMQMDDVLIDIQERHLADYDINAILDNTTRYFDPYLICTKDNRILISEIHCVTDGLGNQFSAFSPTTIKGWVYHLSGPLPRNEIKWAVKLEEWEESLKNE